MYMAPVICGSPMPSPIRKMTFFGGPVEILSKAGGGGGDAAGFVEAQADIPRKRMTSATTDIWLTQCRIFFAGK